METQVSEASVSDAGDTTISSATPYPTNCSSSEDSESETELESSEPVVVSLLSRLRAPTKSDLSRKRKVQSNPPKGEKRSSGLHGISQPKVNPNQRVREFPDQGLTVQLGNLFCSVCRETLSVKRSTVKNHVSSAKHAESQAKSKKRSVMDGNILSALKKYDVRVNPVGQSLSDEQRLYRVKVVRTLLRAGIPLSKLDTLRDLLEESATRLTDTRHMYELIPFILDQEKAQIQSEIRDKYISIIYDGTSRLGEVLAVIIRYIDGWQVKQRLVRLEMLTKSMSGDELARELIDILSVTYSIKSHLRVACMRDGASVNEGAMRVVSVVYPNVLDVRCFSHTLDLVGDKFDLPTLVEFSTAWISLFSHSPKTKCLWKEQTSKAMQSLSKTRWWSRWEIYKQLLVQFGEIKPFLENNKDIGPSLRPKLLKMLTDNRTLAFLKAELAAVVDAGEVFVSATYILEGDGLLVLKCYEQIERIRAAIRSKYYPNLQAIADVLSCGNTAAKQQWIQYGLNCVQGGIDYFMSKFGSDTSAPLNAFKAARLFSPVKVNDIQPVAADVDELTFIPALKCDSTIVALKRELPAYIAKTSGLASEADPLEWFKKYEGDISCWAAAFKLVALIQPSSAAAERAFSLLNASFSSMQQSSLEDYVESSIMLQFNSR